MDAAYDHIQEEAYLKDPEAPGDATKQDQPQASIAEDVQEAYKAFTASPWGAKIGGFFGNVVKQGELVYNQASKELAEVSEDATKGLSDLRTSIINRTRSLSLTTAVADSARAASSTDGEDSQTTPTRQIGDESAESETVLSRLRSEAAKRLKDLQRAEDAADEALLRFGSNIGEFLRDAISIAPPDDAGEGSSAVLFESKDAEGKRVIHASRFDAQLHVIHTSLEGFTKNPQGEEYDEFAGGFDVEKKTDDIASDLSKYPELRATMERLVPDQIPYGDFWKRYYFLRHSIETAESRRRDLLKAASAEDEVGWGDDSESDSESESDSASDEGKAAGKRRASVESSRTIQPPTEGLLKKSSGRKSNDENSQADSEASYDVVGATSGVSTQATGSPKEKETDTDSEPRAGKEKDGESEEESDESEDSDEDWE